MLYLFQELREALIFKIAINLNKNKKEKKMIKKILKTIKPEIKKKESDQPTNKHNTNEKSGLSMLKKSELSFIFLGAGLVTLIIFFLFFRPSESKNSPDNTSKTIKTMEQRIATLEQILEKHQLSLEDLPDEEKQDFNLGIDKTKMARFENTVFTKMDYLTERQNNIETKVSRLEKNIREINKIASRKKLPQKTIIKPKQKFSSIKKSIFYTVKPGDTLYSISKRYNTTVNNLKKINKLHKNSRLYPGDNIIVK